MFYGQNHGGRKLEKNIESPKLVRRECGGWLAVHPPEEPVKIGVVAATEPEAVKKYKEAISIWRQTLGHTRI
jgi:hypothetical protein